MAARPTTPGRGQAHRRAMETFTETPTDVAGADEAVVTIPQYTRRAILGIWAAAAIPMAVLAWVVAPVLSSTLDGPEPFARAIIASLTLGMVWQFVLVAGLVRIEQGNLRWSTLREALWLKAPRSPRTGRVGGKVWLVIVPLIFAFAAEDIVPSLPRPASRDLGLFLESTAGQDFVHGAWGWFAVMLVMFLFNTVLGEELLFRGFLLPRMNGAFGDKDWLVNGGLFAGYHLHVPWMMPVILLDTFVLAWPAKRYRSAWVSISVHSAQSVFFAIAVLGLVLR